MDKLGAPNLTYLSNCLVPSWHEYFLIYRFKTDFIIFWQQKVYPYLTKVLNTIVFTIQEHSFWYISNDEHGKVNQFHSIPGGGPHIYGLYRSDTHTSDLGCVLGLTWPFCTVGSNPQPLRPKKSRSEKSFFRPDQPSQKAL